jgi:hypothetical protein
MTGRVQLASAALVLLALFPHPQNEKKLERKLRNLEHHFEVQKNPVGRAKALAEMMTKEIDVAAAQILHGDAKQGIARLQHYCQLAQQVHNELLATGRKAVHKPAGYMQLQMATRNSLTRLRDLIFMMPIGQQEPVEIVREQIDNLNDQLLEELFPPPSPSKPKDQKKKEKEHKRSRGG